MVCLQTIQQDLSDELWPILVELREEEGKDKKKKGEKNQQIFTKWVIGLVKDEDDLIHNSFPFNLCCECH